MPDDTDWTKLRGRFIVFDGGEGCGKSTQAGKLLAFLQEQGLPVCFVRDPGSTAIGETIRGLLLDPANDAMTMRCEMLLYMAARAQMVGELIRPALERGEVVLCDRFISSTLAYQLGGDGLSREDILSIGEVAVGGCWPDLTILLDMPVELSRQRVKPKFVAESQNSSGPSKDRIEQRPTAYHRQVRRNYLAQAEAMPERYAVIDASRDPEAVFQDVRSAVGRLV